MFLEEDVWWCHSICGSRCSMTIMMQCLQVTSLKKLLAKLGVMYYWPGMRSDDHQKCENCLTCASVHGRGRRVQPPLKSTPVGGPFECIGMDFKQMDMSRRGNRYALVFQDYLTKWPEVYPVADRSAQTVARCLTDLIWRRGVPANTIIHDRAAEFLSDVLQETARVYRELDSCQHLEDIRKRMAFWRGLIVEEDVVKSSLQRREGLG